MQSNGELMAHIRERIMKTSGVIRRICGIGKRRFEKDTLAWSVLGYGAELWGWKEWNEIERLQ